MSKRKTDVQGGREASFEGDGSNSSGAMDTPGRATAAQLANRKIRDAKGARRHHPSPASHSFPAHGQQQSNLPPQGSFGQPFANSAAGAAVGSQQQQQQQQQGTLGFSQQGGGSFGASQSFPPNNPSTSSGNQPGSQSTLFGGFGGGSSGSAFGGQSAEFSFTTQNQNNPFTSSNGTNPNYNSGFSSGYKGTIFNLPPAGDGSTEASSKIQAQASNPFLFGQPTQTSQDQSAGALFAPQSNQSQFSQPASNSFALPSSQSPQPLNLFGQQPKEPSQAQQAIGAFSQPGDSMQTSPDPSPHKAPESNNNPFSFLSPPSKPVTSEGTNSKSNPFDSIKQPSAESSNSLFSRISQPSSAPSFSSAKGQNPSTIASSGTSQSATAPSTGIFAPSTVNKDTGLEAQGSDPEPPVSGSDETALPQNHFVGVKVPTTLNSATIGSPEARKTNGSNAKPTGTLAATSFGSQTSSPPVASAAVTSAGNQKPLSNVPINLPRHFTDSQKRSYTTNHHLRSLNAGFTDTVVSTSNTADIVPLLQYYLERHDEILEAGGVPRVEFQSNKRKADAVASNDPSIEPGKKLKLGASVLGRPLASGTVPKKDVLGASNGSSSNSSMFQLQAAGGNLSGTSNHNNSPGLSDHETNQVPETASRSTTNDQISYPSLPNPTKPKEGSQTANIFKSILDKAGEENSQSASGPMTNGFKAATPFPFQSSSATAAKPLPSTSLFSVAPNSTSQTTVSTADSAAPALQLPKLGSSTPNFLAQFSSTAQETEKKEREKRKADDFDSDDDNEEDWERKDAEQQRAKKQKITAMSEGKVAKLVPGEGFTFEIKERPSEATATNKLAPTTAAEAGSGSSTSSANIGSVDFRSRTSSPTPSTFGGASVFDRSKPLGQDRALTITNNIFGHLSDADSGADGSKTGDADDEDTASEGESETDDNNQGSDTKHIESSGAQRDDIADYSGARSEKPENRQEKPETPSRQPNVSGKSLFDRISKDQDGNAIRAPSPTDDKASVNPFSSKASSNSGNIFGQSLPSSDSANIFGQSVPSKGSTLFGQTSTSKNVSGVFGSSTSPAGDRTFKHNSPIRFGSAAAPSFSFTSATPTKENSKEDVNGTTSPFANLFGAPKAGHEGENAPSSQKPSTLFGSPSGKSTDVGFGFGGPPKSASNSHLDPSLGTSAATSRASSPGAATDTGAESANDSTAEGAEEESHAQLDLANGGPGEEDEDVLYEVRAKALVLEKQKYENKGVGFLRVLKHRETGKVRILLRQDPNGKLVINAALLGGVDYTTKTAKSVSLPIPTEQGTLKPWVVQVGKAEDADGLAKVLQNNKSS